MGREVKRVAMDFDAPLNEVWHGYLMPDRLHETPCPNCENGYSPQAKHLHDLWYGYAPFTPAKPLSFRSPAVWAFAERNVKSAPEYYGTGKDAVEREAKRLATLFNGRWAHHLDQVDVDALLDAGRLMDLTHTWSRETHWQKIDPPVVPTAEQVNAWSLCGFGHDSINASIVIRARCEREGIPLECATCEGRASVETYDGQRAEADAWEPTEPPAGEGWQLWSTTTEGSPISPVFETAEALAVWMSQHKCGFAGSMPSPEAARAFVADGWAPSMIAGGGRPPEDGITGMARLTGEARS